MPPTFWGSINYIYVSVCDAIFNHQKFNTVPSPFPFKHFNEVFSHVAQKATDQNYKGPVD